MNMIDTNIINSLKIIGLNDKEAKVYLSTLEIGQSPASEIAIKAGLKRPTTYVVLDNLIKKGFAAIRKTKTVEMYCVIDPARLGALADNNRQSIVNALPKLKQIYQAQPNRPITRTFEGKVGLEQIYLEAGEYLKTGNEVIYFGSMNHFLNEFGYLLDLWITEMKDKNHRAREIILRNEAKKIDYLKKIHQNKNPNHQIRYFQKDAKISDNDNMIYGDKLAIFSLKGEIFVTIIESKNIADSFRSYFNLMWKSAEKIKF